MPVSFTSPPPGETGYDVAIVGGGPAGAACAAFCAAGGLRTLLLEREKFPREKVCGDCLNPAAWPVLDRLGISDAVRALPCSPVGGVEFIGADGLSFSVPLPAGACGEIGIRRREFDGLLLTTAGARDETQIEETVSNRRESSVAPREKLQNNPLSEIRGRAKVSLQGNAIAFGAREDSEQARDHRVPTIRGDEHPRRE